jgi:hypothetical protein
MKSESRSHHQIIDWIFLVLLLFAIGWIVLASTTTVYFAETHAKNNKVIGELTQNEVVRQDVPIKEILDADTICYDVLFATYRRINSSLLRISLIQGDYRQSFELDASKLTDNYTYSLCFSRTGFSTGNAVLEITGVNGMSGDSPTIVITEDISCGGIVHNGKPKNKSLVFQAYAKKNSAFFPGGFGLFGLAVVGCAAWVLIRYPLSGNILMDRLHHLSKTGIWEFLNSLVDYRRHIFTFSIMAWTLSMVMATVSQFASHPDEALHNASANYYENHHLPPAVGDPSAFSTYSPSRYGVSYINLPGVDYFLTGKFTFFVKSISSAKGFYFNRCFNLFLFFLLCVMIWHSADRLIFFPIIITPQIWYVASYANNDFFPLFIMLVLCSEFLSDRSFYNRALNKELHLIYILPAGVLLGILSISKSNYLGFVLFSVCCLIWNILKSNQFRVDKHLIFSPAAKSSLLLVLCALSIYTMRMGLDVYQNGLDKSGIIEEYANQIAEKGFRPVDIQADILKTPPGLRLKEKGASLESLLIARNWHNLSFDSFFGVYGWCQIEGPPRYYQLMAILSFLLLFYAITQSLASGRFENIVLGVATLCFICLMLAASLYHSWTYDFQPQGRYLFPILGMLSVLVYEIKAYLNRNLLNLFILLMFAASFWSFLFVGIYRIEKIAL